MQTIVYPFCPDFLFSPIFCVLPEDYYVWWGFEDEKLIEYAKEDLTELASSDQPFNYTMLTVDTHFEDGYVCDLCQDLHDGNQYGNVISCSDKAAEIINNEINAATGKSLSEDILKTAFQKLTISTDVNKDAVDDFAAISLEQKFIDQKPSDDFISVEETNTSAK